MVNALKVISLNIRLVSLDFKFSICSYTSGGNSYFELSAYKTVFTQSRNDGLEKIEKDLKNLK